MSDADPVEMFVPQIHHHALLPDEYEQMEGIVRRNATLADLYPEDRTGEEVCLDIIEGIRPQQVRESAGQQTSAALGAGSAKDAAASPSFAIPSRPQLTEV